MTSKTAHVGTFKPAALLRRCASRREGEPTEHAPH
jgi:hypothetical protein